jgi:septum site-determining protein MinC
MRFRGRSFLALVLAPEPPLTDWLAELEAWTQRSPGFFAGKAVILDLSRVPLGKAELKQFLADLDKHGIRVMALEGADPGVLGLGLPPAVNGGRDTGPLDGAGAAAATRTRPPVAQEPTTLLIEQPVRSGQSIIHPKGDVVVMGSLGSGAEVMAGGSIHVYGTLRGRAIAGMSGGQHARIYCRKFEAELVAIDGLYQTADDGDPALRGRSLCIRLEKDTLVFAPLD